MPPVIDASRCTGCGTCAAICNSQIFRFDRAADRVPRVVFPDECWHCDACRLDFPSGAIRLRLPLSLMLLHIDAPSGQGRQS